MKDLDINQIPTGEGGEEDYWNATGSMEDEEESSNGGPPRKKLRLSKEQSRLLEESFRQNHTLNPVISKPNHQNLKKNKIVSTGYNKCYFVLMLLEFLLCAEAEGSIGYAAEAEAKTGWGLVSEP